MSDPSEPIREDESPVEDETTGDVEAHSADGVLGLQDMPEGSDEAVHDSWCISFVSIAID